MFYLELLKKIKRYNLLPVVYWLFSWESAKATSILDSSQVNSNQMEKFAGSSGFESSITIESLMALIIQVFLSLLSLIFIILILYAGYNWMTAGGDEQKVTKAKDTIYRAVIGLVITISAFVLTYFVFNALPFGGGPTVTP